MNTPGQNANDVAGLVFAMMLSSARNSFDGTIGIEVAGKSIAFYVDCQRFHLEHDHRRVASRHGSHHGSSRLARLPLKPETKDLINKALLMKMLKGATLIDTARPEVMHEAEMLEALTVRPDFSYLSEVPRMPRKPRRSSATSSGSASSSPRGRWTHRRWKHRRTPVASSSP